MNVLIYVELTDMICEIQITKIFDQFLLIKSFLISILIVFNIYFVCVLIDFNEIFNIYIIDKVNL